jgi:hypothetical protein
MEEGVVLDLCEPLAKNGHVVAFDRFFTSIALLDELDKRGINAVGTILKTRVGQPFLRSTNRTFRRTNLWPSLAVNQEREERVFLSGRTLSRFGSLQTSTAQRPSRCKGSSAMVRSEQSLVQKLLAITSITWAV